MQQDKKATANAFAIVGTMMLYIICAAWTLFAKGGFIGVINTWGHAIDLSVFPAKNPNLGTMAVGLVAFTLAAWATGYAFAYFIIILHKISRLL